VVWGGRRSGGGLLVVVVVVRSVAEAELEMWTEMRRMFVGAIGGGARAFSVDVFLIKGNFWIGGLGDVA
jgi:hypothetical protein